MKWALPFWFLFSSLQLMSSEGLESSLFPNDKKVNTDAVIIYKDGKILYETYARGYCKDSKHLSWSMAKTISGILIGQSVDDGFLRLENKLARYFPDYKGSATILDFLQMSSGVNFKEEYSGIPVNAGVTEMLYLKGPQQGFAEYVMKRPLRKEKPGNYFYYSSGDTNVLMNVLKKQMSQGEYNNYPWNKFFNPLEINATFEQDGRGTFVGSSYIYMSPRDYLQIGKLLVKKGEYKGKQIIPPWYFKLMTKVSPGVMKNPLKGTSKTRAYSVQVTTNQPIVDRSLPPEYPGLPADSLMLIGHQGQLVIASPSQNLVIIRVATDEGAAFKRDKFFQEINKIIRSRGLDLKVASETHKEMYQNYKKADKEKTILSVREKFDRAKAFRFVPRFLQRFTAKEYCSCLYVAKRTIHECAKDLKVSLPYMPIIKSQKGEVSVSALSGIGLFFPSKAQFISKKLGCTLE